MHHPNNIYKGKSTRKASYGAGLHRILSGVLLLATLQGFGAFPPPGNTEDPVLISKEIIVAHPEHWGPGASNTVLDTFGPVKEWEQDRLYLLMESPGLAIDYAEGLTGATSGHIPREGLLELLKNIVTAPETTSRRIAAASLAKGLDEYKEAYEIAGAYLNSRDISPEDAIAFLDNRYGYAKLEDAWKLLHTAQQAKPSSLDKAGIKDQLRRIERNYPQNIPVQDALKLIHDFYAILEQQNTGLAAFEPYRNFKVIMEELNRSRIAQRRKFRSTIEVTKPGSGTVWALNDPVSLQWTTSNIPPEKSLRFFLVKGETVVQELGTFKNTGAAEGIRLNRNIDSGDDYKVVGIELFPANKYYIAKMATPAFSIKRPERPKLQTKAPEETPVAEPAAPEVARMSFEGRKINYVQELTVNNSAIRISIWDHGRQDSDIVSIYLNGEAVVDRHYLTYRKEHFDLELDPGSKNDLFLYAHNLGLYPPNTVSIEIVDGDAAENIVLNSDLKSCEAVLINVRP